MSKPITYTSVQPIISTVRDTLYSYDSAGLIDTGKFYRWIQSELMNLGIAYFEKAEEVFKVSNYRINLPEDFYQLYAIYRCSFNDKTGTETYNVKINPKMAFIETCEQEARKAAGPCGNWEYFGTIIKRETKLQFQQPYPLFEEYKLKSLLRYSNRVNKKLCTKDCPNFGSKSPDEFTIDEYQAYFNFNEDQVFLQYYRLKTDENGLPLIPNRESVINLIEKRITYELFREWWLNGEGDVQQRKMDTEREWREAKAVAMKEVKMPTYQELINSAIEDRTKFTIFDLNSRSQIKN